MSKVNVSAEAMRAPVISTSFSARDLVLRATLGAGVVGLWKPSRWN